MLPAAGINPIALIKLPERKSILELETYALKQSHPLLGSVDLQKKAISDLWPIVKRHEEKLRVDKWDSDTGPWSVLNEILLAVNRMTPGKGFDWELRRDNGTNEFYLEVEKVYELKNDAYVICMSPILKIARLNKELHDLIIHMLTWMYQPKTCNISILNDDFVFDYFDEQLEDFEDENGKKETNRLRTFLHYYKNGHPAQYAKVIRKLPEISVDELAEKIHAFHPVYFFEESGKKWLQSGLSLIQSGFDIDDFFEKGADEYCDGARPWDYLQIFWGCSKADPAFEECCAWIDSSMQEGIVNMHKTFELRKNGEPLPDKMPTFPYDLEQFFIDGQDFMALVEASETL